MLTGAPAPEQPRPLDGAVETGVVRFEHRRADHRLERLHGSVVEVLDEPEVEEGDLPAGPEHVVARVRVAVERVEPVQAPEHEAEDRLRGQVLLRLAPREQLIPSGPGRQSVVSTRPVDIRADDGGDVDERMAVVEVGEGTLVGGLDAVVELLADPGLDLGHHRCRVEALEELAHHRAQQIGVGQIGADGVRDPRVLDLDGDGALPPCRVPRQRPVDLTDGRRGDGLGIPPTKSSSGAAPSSRRTTPAASSGLIGGALARRSPSASRSGSGRPSSR